MTTLHDMMDAQNAKCGAGTVFSGVQLRPDPKRIPTGIWPIDLAVGGGLPVWGTTCLWGGECVHGDTKVRVSTYKPDGTRQTSSKTTTVRRLYERFHRIPSQGKGSYHRKESEDSFYFTSCVNDAGAIFLNRIMDVMSNGVKMCYEVELRNGFTLVCTDQHELMTPDGEFNILANLQVGDEVMVHNNTRFTNAACVSSRPAIMVKSHPYWPEKIVDHKYVYKRGVRSRAVYEANLNGMALEGYISILNSPESPAYSDLKFISPDAHVHHIDEDWHNDDPSNLELISPKAHGVLHATENHNKLRFQAAPMSIVSISQVGEEDVYDLRCSTPHHNYVADGFVVHNSSGKTTSALNTMATAAVMCWKCFRPLAYCECSQSALPMTSAWADVEGTLDQDWAAAVGNDPKNYIVALADYGEQCINIVDASLQADDCGLVIVDSLATLTPAAEFDGMMEDQFIGLQARLISKMVRKLKQRLIRERKREHPCMLLFTNQMRTKIGVTFGSPEEMPGGHGMKHEFSLLLRMGKKALDKNGADKKYIIAARNMAAASRHSVMVKKSKVLTLHGKGEFVRVTEDFPELMLSKGQVDDYNSVMQHAKDLAIVAKTGKDWVLLDQKFRTLTGIKEFWKSDPDSYLVTKQLVIETLKESLHGPATGTTIAGTE